MIGHSFGGTIIKKVSESKLSKLTVQSETSTRL